MTIFNSFLHVYQRLDIIHHHPSRYPYNWPLHALQVLRCTAGVQYTQQTTLQRGPFCTGRRWKARRSWWWWCFSWLRDTSTEMGDVMYPVGNQTWQLKHPQTKWGYQRENHWIYKFIHEEFSIATLLAGMCHDMSHALRVLKGDDP